MFQAPAVGELTSSLQLRALTVAQQSVSLRKTDPIQDSYEPICLHYDLTLDHLTVPLTDSSTFYMNKSSGLFAALLLVLTVIMCEIKQDSDDGAHAVLHGFPHITVTAVGQRRTG